MQTSSLLDWVWAWAVMLTYLFITWHAAYIDWWLAIFWPLIPAIVAGEFSRRRDE